MATLVQLLQAGHCLPASHSTAAACPQSATAETTVEPPVGLAVLSRVLLQLGAMSFGGKSTNSYLFQELVRRRGWVSNEDFTEAFALAKLLPGSTGSNLVVTVTQLFRGPRAGLLCLAAFTLPGALLMLAASVLLFGQALPAWAMQALDGGAAAALGLLLASSLQMAQSARKARLWLPFAMAAFLGSAILQLNFVGLLASLGAASVFANRGQKVVAK